MHSLKTHSKLLTEVKTNARIHHELTLRDIYILRNNVTFYYTSKRCLNEIMEADNENNLNPVILGFWHKYKYTQLQKN